MRCAQPQMSTTNTDGHHWSSGSDMSSQPGTRYRSEVFVPVVPNVDASSSSSHSHHRDTSVSSPSSAPSSQQSQTSSWNTMHQRLDERRRQWNDEVRCSHVTPTAAYLSRYSQHECGIGLPAYHYTPIRQFLLKPTRSRSRYKTSPSAIAMLFRSQKKTWYFHLFVYLII